MTAKTIARPVIVTGDKKAAKSAAPKAFAFTGRNALVRNTALQCVATCAYVEGQSRAETIKHVSLALGKKPSPVEIAAAQLEYVVGSAAQKLDGSAGFNRVAIGDCIALTRKLVTQYARPAQDGVKSKLGKKLGYRTPEQHKAIRAAEQRWSLILAELGLNDAATQSETDAKKRSASMKGTTARGKAPTGPELVKGSKSTAKDTAEACATIVNLADSIVAYAKKNAGVVPTDFGMALNRFQNAIHQLEADRKANANVTK